MKTIATISECEQLYTGHITHKGPKWVTNFFVNKGMLAQYIDEGKVKYEIVDGAPFIFVDQWNFYKLYFFGLTTAVRRVPTADKVVCCDIYEQRKNDTKRSFIHSLLLNSGFSCRQEYEQVRLCYGYLHGLSNRY